MSSTQRYAGQAFPQEARNNGGDSTMKKFSGRALCAVLVLSIFEHIFAWEVKSLLHSKSDYEITFRSWMTQHDIRFETTGEFERRLRTFAHNRFVGSQGRKLSKWCLCGCLFVRIGRRLCMTQTSRDKFHVDIKQSLFGV